MRFFAVLRAAKMQTTMDRLFFYLHVHFFSTFGCKFGIMFISFFSLARQRFALSAGRGNKQ